MYLIAAFTLIGILALIFVAAAYFAESQSADQPRPHWHRYMYSRFYRYWPEESTRRRLSFREQIRYRAELDRQLQKSKEKYTCEHNHHYQHDQDEKHGHWNPQSYQHQHDHRSEHGHK